MRGGNSSSRSGKASGKIGRLSTHPGNGTNGGERTGEGHSRNERGERERGEFVFDLVFVFGERKYTFSRQLRFSIS